MDNPGHYSCDCVPSGDPCFGDGMCMIESNCPDSHGLQIGINYVINRVNRIKTCFEKSLGIVRNLIPFQIVGLQSKTEALFRKMIIDFFVAFYPYFTMVKFFRVRSPLRSP